MVHFVYEFKPESTYKDHCLKVLATLYPSVVGNNLTTTMHPGKPFLEQDFWPFLFRNFSKASLADQSAFNKDLFHSSSNAQRMFLPRSEKYLTDVPSGFYIPDSSARDVMFNLINGNITRSEGNNYTPLAINYREDPRFKGQSPENTERLILYERLRLIQELPQSALKDGLVLYSLQTAFDNMSALTDRKLLAEELMTLAQSYREQFQTDKGKDQLFEMEFRMLTDCLAKPVSKEFIAKTFSTRAEYFDYILSRLPEKSSFRDGFISLGLEAYPIKISEALDFSNMMFANDYATQLDSRVGAERAGMELIRAIKQKEDVTSSDISDLVLWMADERRQVRSIEDFASKLSHDEMGKQLLQRALQEMPTGLLPELQNSLGRRVLELTVQNFTKLPISAKRLVIKRVLQGVEGMDLYKLYRVGLPVALQKGVEDRRSQIGIGNNPATFNSMLEAFTEDSSTRKQIFFDLVLGEKGSLEEPIASDPNTFVQRFEQGFNGSEMHRFIDQVLNISFRNTNFDDTAARVARVTAHSYIEGLAPVRRATVLQNLLTEIPKIDFSEPDSQRLQAKVFAITLSAMGLVGAKIGQIDELVPPQFRQDVASLKHGTKPMPKLMVADIFNQEGLSGDYVIVEAAGAASTASGYVIENPSGERQFAKIIRPEVVQEWKGDFQAVRYMIESLRASGLLNTETTPILNQLQSLVERELSTKNEVNNVVQYVSAESESSRTARQGLRAVRMPLERFTTSGVVNEQPQGSLIIFEELLNKDQFTELSRMESFVDRKLLEPVYAKVIEDFLYRSLELGSWHTDLHGGNILVSREGIVRRQIKGDEDIVLIDFGQTGTAEEQSKKQNAARLLVGLGLGDRGEVARALFEAISNKQGVSFEQVRDRLPVAPGKLQEELTRVIAQYQIEDYLTNFIKASINTMPYFRKLPLSRQFELISPYMGLSPN